MKRPPTPAQVTVLAALRDGAIVFVEQTAHGWAVTVRDIDHATPPPISMSLPEFHALQRGKWISISYSDTTLHSIPSYTITDKGRTALL